jgi:hypothetical protein
MRCDGCGGDDDEGLAGVSSEGHRRLRKHEELFRRALLSAAFYDVLWKLGFPDTGRQLTRSNNVVQRRSSCQAMHDEGRDHNHRTSLDM